MRRRRSRGRWVDEGVLERVLYNERPEWYEYHLTKKGLDLNVALMLNRDYEGQNWETRPAGGGVYDRLVGDGHTVLAPPNPLRGVPYDASFTTSVIDQIEGPVVLVGHSYGGAVITVAGSSDKVAGLVYVAPDEGESVTTSRDASRRSRWARSCARPSWPTAA